VAVSEPFFAMRNNHVSGCGEPPLVRNEAPGRYYGYFENAYGEQWVFVYDRANKTAELRGGDVGRGQVFQVVGGRAPGLVLGQEEAHWLRAGWSAATGERDSEDVVQAFQPDGGPESGSKA
jgi:hypothetical protein